MALDCVTGGVNAGLPGKIVDSSTLSISIDNMGVATLSISVFTTQEAVPSILPFDLGNQVFRGFLESDTPVKLQGTDYIEHRIVAKGEICDS